MKLLTCLLFLSMDNLSSLPQKLWQNNVKNQWISLQMGQILHTTFLQILSNYSRGQQWMMKPLYTWDKQICCNYITIITFSHLLIFQQQHEKELALWLSTEVTWEQYSNSQNTSFFNNMHLHIYPEIVSFSKFFMQNVATPVLKRLCLNIC